MPWQGLTSQCGIREETLIHLFTQYRSRPLAAGMEIQVRTRQQSWLKISIVQLTGDVLDIETPDGCRWRMTPLAPGEPAPTSSPHARARAWIVRSRIEAGDTPPPPD